MRSITVEGVEATVAAAVTDIETGGAGLGGSVAHETIISELMNSRSNTFGITTSGTRLPAYAHDIEQGRGRGTRVSLSHRHVIDERLQHAFSLGSLERFTVQGGTSKRDDLRMRVGTTLFGGMRGCPAMSMVTVDGIREFCDTFAGLGDSFQNGGRPSTKGRDRQQTS